MCVSGPHGGQKIPLKSLELELKLCALEIDPWFSGETASVLNWRAIFAAMETSLYQSLCHYSHVLCPWGYMCTELSQMASCPKIKTKIDGNMSVKKQAAVLKRTLHLNPALNTYGRLGCILCCSVFVFVITLFTLSISRY